MKRIKSLFLKIKAKMTLKTYQKPLAITLLTLLMVNLVVLLIGAVIALAIDNAYFNAEFFQGSFIEAFIANVKWMVSPNSLNALTVRDHWRMMILAVVIIVIGMVLFSGAIIATVTTALRAFIDKKSKAKGQILVDGHFVILNWNAKVPDMVFNLMVKGFKENIVILSNRSKDYIESEIKSLFLANEVNRKYKANLIIKEGDSLLRANLEDISIEKATQICVMTRDDMEDGEDDNIVNSDLLNLKILLRLGSFNIRPDCQIVVETNSDDTRGQIENLSYTIASLKKLSIVPVSFNRKLGQIIAQSLVMPRISDVYSELFSFDGSEFYSLDTQDSIDEFMKTHNESIPVFKDKQLFVLAEDEKQLQRTRARAFDKAIPLQAKENSEVEGASLFIIGDNSKSEFVLDELRKNQDIGSIDFSLKHYHKNENEKLIADLKATEGPKKVLILSDDTVGEETYDANVFVSLIELSKAFPKRENITYITELLDSRNLSSVHDFNIKNTIISNRLMSLLITQLALNQGGKVFFDRVLSTANDTSKENDFDICITPALALLQMDGPLSFASKAELVRSFYEAFGHHNILLGVACKDGDLFFLDKNQDEEKRIQIDPEDELVYFKYFG